MDVMNKLAILAESAKFDVSCASSGVTRRNKGGLGNTRSFGICHAWSADGRCISLLKVLLSNDCVYDCRYCANRRTNPVPRASFTARELADLTIQFYRRNYIEGLFLSSAVEVSPDATMEKMVEVLRIVRQDYRFHGYIHVKVIPGTDPLLLRQAGRLADRMSVNIEQPTEAGLRLLAPQKSLPALVAPMRLLSREIEAQQDAWGKSRFPTLEAPRLVSALPGSRSQIVAAPPASAPARSSLTHRPGRTRFLPGGQSTQMITCATSDSDLTILQATQALYQRFKLKRVYFSAYIPINVDVNLPALSVAPPLQREHRLYQSDWLLRYYNFKAEEIVDPRHANLDIDIDPKMAWALRHSERFPLEINKASYWELLRIPGIGLQSAQRIARQRRLAALSFDNLKKLGVVTKRARYFITCKGRYAGEGTFDPATIRRALTPPPEPVQLTLF